MLSAICGSRQRVCDLCEQPAIKALDTKLMPHSLVHDACLTERFPGFADDQLQMRNPRSATSFFTLSQIREKLINASAVKREVYFKILERLLGERFDQLPAATKIDLLADVALIMPDRADGHRPHLQIGPRPLGRRECLELALELALLHQPDAVPRISTHLLALEPEYATLSLFGINFKRARIVAWADGIDLPVTADRIGQQRAIDAVLQRDDAENVHAIPVVQQGLERIRRMQFQGDQLLGVERVYRQIEAHMRRCSAPQAAFDGLQRVQAAPDRVPHFFITPSDAVTIVWRYVNAQTDPALAADLRAAVVARLVDIGETRPCGLGMVQRLIDTPTAIDFSMAGPISAEALRDEVAALAAEVNEEFDALYGEAAEAQLHALPPAPHSGARACKISEIKRAMLYQRAHVELVLLRKLSREQMEQAVNQIFPAGLVL